MCPSSASSASTCASDVPRNRRPSEYANPRCTASAEGLSSWPLDDPLRRAARRVDRVRARLRREIHRARDHERSRLERGHLGQRVVAHRWSFATLPRSISASGEKRSPATVRLYAGQSPGGVLSVGDAAGAADAVGVADAAVPPAPPPAPGRSRRKPTSRSAAPRPKRFVLASSPPPSNLARAGVLGRPPSALPATDCSTSPSTRRCRFAGSRAARSASWSSCFTRTIMRHWPVARRGTRSTPRSRRWPARTRRPSPVRRRVTCRAWAR